MSKKIEWVKLERDTLSALIDDGRISALRLLLRAMRTGQPVASEEDFSGLVADGILLEVEGGYLPSCVAEALGFIESRAKAGKASADSRKSLKTATHVEHMSNTCPTPVEHKVNHNRTEQNRTLQDNTEDFVAKATSSSGKDEAIASLSDNKGVQGADQISKRAKKPKPEMTDDQWLASIAEAYPAIDCRAEAKRAEVWANANNRQATRRFLVNWFSRASERVKPVAINNIKQQTAEQIEEERRVFGDFYR